MEPIPPQTEAEIRASKEAKDYENKLWYRVRTLRQTYDNWVAQGRPQRQNEHAKQMFQDRSVTLTWYNANKWLDDPTPPPSDDEFWVQAKLNVYVNDVRHIEAQTWAKYKAQLDQDQQYRDRADAQRRAVERVYARADELSRPKAQSVAPVVDVSAW